MPGWRLTILIKLIGIIVLHSITQPLFQFCFFIVFSVYSTVSLGGTALRGLYLCLCSPHCPPVCMPAAGCQPTRPPGQLLQPLSLLQRHQHRQRSTRGHQLLSLLWDVYPEGGQHSDTLLVCGNLFGNCSGSSAHVATCWGATATAASYHFTCRWVMGFAVLQRPRRGLMDHLYDQIPPCSPADKLSAHSVCQHSTFIILATFVLLFLPLFFYPSHLSVHAKLRGCNLR